MPNGDRSLLLAVVAALALGLLLLVYSLAEDDMNTRTKAAEAEEDAIYMRPWTDLDNSTWVLGFSERNMQRQLQQDLDFDNLGGQLTLY